MGLYMGSIGSFISTQFSHYIHQVMHYSTVMYDPDWTLKAGFNNFFTPLSFLLAIGIAWWLAFGWLRQAPRMVRVVAFLVPLLNLCYPFITVLVTNSFVFVLALAAIAGIIYLLYSHTEFQHRQAKQNAEYARKHPAKPDRRTTTPSTSHTTTKVLGDSDVDGDELDHYRITTKSGDSVYIIDGKNGPGWYNIK